MVIKKKTNKAKIPTDHMKKKKKIKWKETKMKRKKIMWNNLSEYAKYASNVMRPR